MQNGHGRQSAAHLMFSIIAGWESDHEENHYYDDAYRLRKKAIALGLCKGTPRQPRNVSGGPTSIPVITVPDQRELSCSAGREPVLDLR